MSLLQEKREHVSVLLYTFIGLFFIWAFISLGPERARTTCCSQMEEVLEADST
jgi:hypothetical protein